MARRCSYCGKDSPDDSVYCNYCSRPLEVDQICPKCGAKNPSYGVFCGSCGSDLPKVERPPEPPTSRPPPGTEPSVPKAQGPGHRACPRCGNRVSIYDIECPNCRQTIESEGGYYESAYDGPEPRSGGLTAAGVLTIVTGVLAIGQGGIYLLVGSIAADIGVSVAGLTCCGSLSVLFGLAALFGGYNALTRSSWAFALLGAILAMLSIAFYIGFLLGLIALILVAISKEEFTS